LFNQVTGSTYRFLRGDYLLARCRHALKLDRTPAATRR
jgi:hypothetical protein